MPHLHRNWRPALTFAGRSAEPRPLFLSQHGPHEYERYIVDVSLPNRRDSRPLLIVEVAFTQTQTSAVWNIMRWLQNSDTLVSRLLININENPSFLYPNWQALALGANDEVSVDDFMDFCNLQSLYQPIIYSLPNTPSVQYTWMGNIACIMECF